MPRLNVPVSVCSKVVDEYAQAVAKLCIRLIEILSVTLGLEPHVLGEHINVKSIGLRTSFNFYPRCPQPELALGIMPHADTSFVTVLQQDETPGLEVQKDDQWVLVPPTPNAFVINMGDLLQVCTPTLFQQPRKNQLTSNQYKFEQLLNPSL